MEYGLYILIPLSVVLVFVIGVIFFRTLRGGQFDDLEGPAFRIIADDPDPPREREELEARARREQTRRNEDDPGASGNRSERVGEGGNSRSMLRAAEAGRECNLGRGSHGAQDARHTGSVGEHPSTAQRSNPTAQ